MEQAAASWVSLMYELWTTSTETGGRFCWCLQSASSSYLPAIRNDMRRWVHFMVVWERRTLDQSWSTDVCSNGKKAWRWMQNPELCMWHKRYYDEAQIGEDCWWFPQCSSSRPSQQVQLVEGQAVPHATDILRELISPWTLCRFILCLSSGSKALEPAWFAIYRCGQNFHSKLSNELSAVSWAQSGRRPERSYFLWCATRRSNHACLCMEG